MRTLSEILKKTKYDKNNLEIFLIECSLDYLYFAEHVLGFELGEYHKEWYELCEKFPRLCLQAFRGSGKTNFIAGYYVWKAVFEGKINVLIVSETFEQAKLVLKIVRNMVSDNELLRQYVPQNRDAAWRATELNLVNGAVFYSRSYTDSVRGLRIDYLLCDEAGKYEDKSTFWTAISPVVQLNRGRIVVIGTPKSHNDLLHELGENEEYYAELYPSEKNGQPLWPQKYTCEPHDVFGRRSLVAVRKEIGDLPYMQEFLLIPISASNSLFPYELTGKAIDDSEGFEPYGKISERYFVGCDLALSPKGDFTVYTVLKVSADYKKLVYATRFRGDIDEQKKRLLKINKDFKPVKILIDKTGLGEQIFREMAQILHNVEPMHFTADEKYKMILDLRHVFETFEMVIPNSKKDINCYNYTQQLLKELNEYVVKSNTPSGKVRFAGGQFDDTVISLALANKASISEYGTASISYV
jgi:Terminase large subunit, T4likevirus-type, N-terminal